MIACANLANLTLARATLRSREISIRLALGATRGRVIRQLIAESLIVSFAGALAGLVLAHWCIQGMLALNPPDIQRPELIAINWVVFAFSAGLSLLTTLLFGLAPAVAASSADLNATLKSAGGWGGSAARLRGRQFLITIEVALALILVAGAGLMLRSFYGLVSSGVGFNTAAFGYAGDHTSRSALCDRRGQVAIFPYVARSRPRPSRRHARDRSG